MISDSGLAKEISDLMLDIFRRIDESCATVRARCSADEASAYQKAAGRIAAEVVMDVLEPLYEKNPTLKPHNWDA